MKPYSLPVNGRMRSRIGLKSPPQAGVRFFQLVAVHQALDQPPVELAGAGQNEHQEQRQHRGQHELEGILRRAVPEQQHPDQGHHDRNLECERHRQIGGGHGNGAGGKSAEREAQQKLGQLIVRVVEQDGAGPPNEAQQCRGQDQPAPPDRLGATCIIGADEQQIQAQTDSDRAEHEAQPDCGGRVG